MGGGWRQTTITLSRYMVGSKAQAYPLTSVELLQLLHFHTTDMVYFVHPTGIQTFNPWISSTATLHLSTKLNWISKRRGLDLYLIPIKHLVKCRYVCYL